MKESHKDLMQEMVFKKMDGTIIENPAEYVKKFFEDKSVLHTPDRFELSIGTDSYHAKRGKVFQYVTVICMYIRGKGAHIIYSKSKRHDIKDLYTKLWWEIEYTMSVANYLKNEGVFQEASISEIHLDINSNPEYDSNMVYKAAMGYVESMGYTPKCKPDALCASYIADFLARPHKDSKEITIKRKKYVK